MNFILDKSQKIMFHDAIKRCEDMIDIQGWRYSEDLGMDVYSQIPIDDPMVDYQFMVCVSFLKHFFPKAGKSDTISSFDLRGAAELWWYKTQEEKVYIENGIMLLAIVAKGLAPKDLWFSMDLHQQALIPITKWNKFCVAYNYTTKVDWQSLNNFDETDVVKIN